MAENPEYMHMDADTMEVAAVALNAPYIWEEREQYMNSEDREGYNMCQAMREWAEEERVVGAQETLVKMICKKLRKGKTVEVIAEEVEEEIDLVQSICNTAEAFAPTYDWEKVFPEWFGVEKLAEMRI